MKDEVWLTRYGEYLTEKRGFSPNSLSCYLRDIRQLGVFLHRSSPEKCFESAQERDIRRYVDQLLESGKSAATVSRAAASIRGFYAYLTDVAGAVSNPCSQLKTARPAQKAPQILTAAEVQTLLRQPECVDPKGYRDRAMLELLYSAGLRVSELVSLDVADADLSAASLYCRGREDVRTVPLPPATVKILREYIQFIRPRMVGEREQSALFVNMGGTRMSRQGFWKVFKGYQEKSGITKEVTPHMLRQSFAAHRLEKGADVRDLQKLLGYALISSTQAYSRVSI